MSTSADAYVGKPDLYVLVIVVENSVFKIKSAKAKIDVHGDGLINFARCNT